MLHNRLAQLREERAEGDRGFTLIELLVVVVIIGILIAIAIPLYLNYKKGAADKSAQSDLRNTISVMETCNTDNGAYPTATVTFTGGSSGSSAAAGTCTAQKVNVSSGTTLNYYPDGTAANYLLIATNANGNVTGATNGYYCYASAAGGSVVKKTAATTPAAYAAAC